MPGLNRILLENKKKKKMKRRSKKINRNILILFWSKSKFAEKGNEILNLNRYYFFLRMKFLLEILNKESKKKIIMESVKGKNFRLAKLSKKIRFKPHDKTKGKDGRNGKLDKFKNVERSFFLFVSRWKQRDLSCLLLSWIPFAARATGKIY